MKIQFVSISTILVLLCSCGSTNPQPQFNSLVGTGGTNTQNNTINNYSVAKEANKELTALKTDITLQTNLLQNLKSLLVQELSLLDKGQMTGLQPAPFNMAVYDSVRINNPEALTKVTNSELNSIATFYNFLAQINRELDVRMQVTTLPYMDRGALLGRSNKLLLGFVDSAIAKANQITY